MSSPLMNVMAVMLLACAAFAMAPRASTFAAAVLAAGALTDGANPASDPVAEARPVLLVDQAHGNGEVRLPLRALAEKLEVELRTATAPLDEASLRGVRLLAILGPQEPLTAAEITAVGAFVQAGGSLLVVIDEERRQSLEKTRLNTLLAPYGLELTGDTEYLHNRGAIAHAGEIHRADREIPYSGGRAVRGGKPFAFMLDREGRPAEPFAAAVRIPQGGRVVAIGEGMAVSFFGSEDGQRLTGTTPQDTQYWGRDSAIFMEELIAWLIAR